MKEDEAERLEIEYLFHRLVEILPPKNKEPLEKYWKKISDMSGEPCPAVKTDLIEKRTYGFSMGAYIEINLRLAKKQNESLIDTIYHEIGHSYHIATGELTLVDINEDPLKIKKAEGLANEFSRKAQKRMSNINLNHLRGDERLISLAQNYNLSPLL